MLHIFHSWFSKLMTSCFLSGDRVRDDALCVVRDRKVSSKILKFVPFSFSEDLWHAKVPRFFSV